MPIFRGDLLDNVVWDWVRSLIEDPEALAEGWNGMQVETRYINQALFDLLDLIQNQLADTEKQLGKLVDLYLSGDFPKELLLERKQRLEALAQDLKREHAQLSMHIQKITYSDADIKTIVDFCNKIHDNLDSATFEGKHRILELLDVRGTLAIENEEKVVYVKCILAQRLLSVARTSPLSSTGATGIIN